MWRFNTLDVLKSMSRQGGSEGRTYTKEEMLAHAHARGFVITDATFRDWIKVGLLGTASTRNWPGRGHGSGSVARWSHQQLSFMLLFLAQKQVQKITSNAPLCDFPVWRWLYWANLGGVELAQVKRALITWQKEYQQNSQKERSVRKHVRELIKQCASPHAIGVREFVNDLTSIAMTKQFPDETTLRELFALIVDPKGRGEAKGPTGLERTPEYLSRRIFYQGLAAQLNLEDLPDPLWDLARVSLLLVRQQYQVAQREWETTTEPTPEWLFPRASLRALLDSSCFLLLYALAALQHGIHPHVQANLQPRVWLTHEARATIQTVSVPISLLLPNSSPVHHLQIDVSVSYRDHPWNISFTLPYI